MTNIATFEEENLLGRSLGISPAANRYLAIFDNNVTTTELEAGTLTNEITGYTGDRPQISFDAISQVGGKATTQNSADIEFASMPAVTVTHFAVMDAATLGNLLWWGALTTQRSPASGDTLRFSAGEVTIDLD